MRDVREVREVPLRRRSDRLALPAEKLSGIGPVVTSRRVTSSKACCGALANVEGLKLWPPSVLVWTETATRALAAS